jgi:general secretion pathway protein H
MRRTLPPPRRRNARGLTLLEILVVIGILVLIMGLAVSGFGRIGGVRLRNETNKVAAAIRHTFNRSVSLGLYMRMVIDLDGESFSVEGSENPTFLRKNPIEPGLDPDSAEAQDAERSTGKSKSSKKKSDDDDTGTAAAQARIASRRAQFTTDDVIGTQKLEGGSAFDGVTVAGQSDPVTSGKAYIHFFPNGWVEPAVIHTTDGESTFYTLQVSPLTGKVSSLPGKVDPPRNFGEAERTEEEGE